MVVQKKEPAPFDFEAWLSGGKRPARKVTLYTRNDLQAEIVDLEKQLEDALDGNQLLQDNRAHLEDLQAQLSARENSDRMVGGIQSLRGQIVDLEKIIKDQEQSPAVTKIRARIEAVQKEIAASGQEFTVQALIGDEMLEIDAQYPMPPRKGRPDDDEEYDREATEVAKDRFIAYTAAQIVAPRTFTFDEVKRLRQILGEAEFGKLFRAAQETSGEMSVSTPTWHGNSEERRVS